MRDHLTDGGSIPPSSTSDLGVPTHDGGRYGAESSRAVTRAPHAISRGRWTRPAGVGTLRDVTADSSPFALPPYEDVIGGVRWYGGRLRLRSTIGAAVLSIYGLVVAALVVILGVGEAAYLAIAVAVVMVAITVRHLVCRVEAADETIAVVNKWSRRTVPVADVQAVIIEECRPGLGFSPFAGPATIWPRTFDAGTLRLRDGTLIRRDALVGMPRGERDELPTPIKKKVEILRRWVAAETSPS